MRTQGLQREGSGSLPSGLHTGTSPEEGAEARRTGRPRCTELSGKTRTDGGHQAAARSRSWPLDVVPALLVWCLLREQACCGRDESTAPAAWWGDCFVFYKFFLKQGLIPWPFFVVLWPLIFTKNHCVYMK